MNEDFNNKWGLVTGILQVLDYNLNIKQISNDEIFAELQKQDKVLEQHTQELQKQTNNYLEKIIKQNEKIIKLLSK
jgi:aminoglycoside phosphotransferase family enzyme